MGAKRNRQTKTIFEILYWNNVKYKYTQFTLKFKFDRDHSHRNLWLHPKLAFKQHLTLFILMCIFSHALL